MYIQIGAANQGPAPGQVRLVPINHKAEWREWVDFPKNFWLLLQEGREMEANNTYIFIRGTSRVCFLFNSSEMQDFK